MQDFNSWSPKVGGETLTESFSLVSRRTNMEIQVAKGEAGYSLLSQRFVCEYSRRIFQVVHVTFVHVEAIFMFHLTFLDVSCSNDSEVLSDNPLKNSDNLKVSKDDKGS
jgi:hypothetical protein